MLPNCYAKLDKDAMPRIGKRCNGRDASSFGAFAHGSRLELFADVPRSLGAQAVVLRICRDGERDWDLPLRFVSSSLGVDRYSVTLRTEEMCDENGGLFFYELLFLRGLQTLFTDSMDNLSFSLSQSSQNRFSLLIHRADLTTPAWLREGTMYHIFPDRFCRGEGEVTLREGAKEEHDWENGIPQYAKKAGDPLANDLFFGGNLWGVAEKLDYLQGLGITVIYLSPIFRAASNHRYDTGDYNEIDPYLGGRPAFDRLISEAHKRGIKVILDGVFNHTGDDSLYFNRYGTYTSLGAYQSAKSPYREWFNFEAGGKYECWWGIDILPRLRHANEDCRRYFTGKNGIGQKWIAAGADGWRLDVADELCDGFLDEFRESVKSVSEGDAAIIGEVWENAVTKISYGQRRKYFMGGQLDSVMNYPFRASLLSMLRTGDTEFFVRTLTELYATYPREVCDALMNIIGSHDTPRALTLLGDETEGAGKTNDELARLRLSSEQRKEAREKLRLASLLQYTVYGIPSLYYGDEAGLEGYHDPFCRLPYPWGREDGELLKHYRLLGKIRREHAALRGGEFRILAHEAGSFLFERSRNGDRILVGVNLGTEEKRYPLTGAWKDLIGGKIYRKELVLPIGAWALIASM
jgi:glycosidase